MTAIPKPRPPKKRPIIEIPSLPTKIRPRRYVIGRAILSETERPTKRALVHINAKPPIRLIQLSDLHLTGRVGADPSYQKFLQVLDLACQYEPDFFVLTGDLVNDGVQAGYAWLFGVLNQTGVPYACIAGNHDVTHEHNAHLPFEQRTFSPIKKHPQLLDCQRILLGHWQILLLDSSIAGDIAGRLSYEQLVWLSHQMTTDRPTIIALHHHPVAVGSAWIDKYKLQNHQMFLALILGKLDTKKFNRIKQHNHHRQTTRPPTPAHIAPLVRATSQRAIPHRIDDTPALFATVNPNIRPIVLCGHIHQAHTLRAQNAQILTAPAVSRQFLPYADDFCLDNLPSGFRLLVLDDHHLLDSQVIRLDN